MQTKTTIRFFTIADYEKEQEYIFSLLFGILICLYLLVCKNICKLLNNRMHAPRTFYCHESHLRCSPLLCGSLGEKPSMEPQFLSITQYLFFFLICTPRSVLPFLC